VLALSRSCAFDCTARMRFRRSEAPLGLQIVSWNAATFLIFVVIQSRRKRLPFTSVLRQRSIKFRILAPCFSASALSPE
jgi:hypothetical protein